MSIKKKRKSNFNLEKKKKIGKITFASVLAALEILVEGANATFELGYSLLGYETIETEKGSISTKEVLQAYIKDAFNNKFIRYFYLEHKEKLSSDEICYLYRGITEPELCYEKTMFQEKIKEEKVYNESTQENFEIISYIVLPNYDFALEEAKTEEEKNVVSYINSLENVEEDRNR